MVVEFDYDVCGVIFAETIDNVCGVFVRHVRSPTRDDILVVYRRDERVPRKYPLYKIKNIEVNFYDD